MRTRLAWAWMVSGEVMIFAAMLASFTGTPQSGTPPWGNMNELTPAFVISDWDDESEESLPFLSNPAAVAFGQKGEIFVVDAGNHRIAVFDARGNFLREFGRAGRGPGEFAFGGNAFHAVDIATAGGRVLVLDPGQRRVHEFSEAGVFRDSLALTATPRSLATTGEWLYVSLGGSSVQADGEILAVDLESGATQRFGAPMIRSRDSRVARLNSHYLAARPGVILQVYQRWPVLRFVDVAEQSASTGRYLDHGWWAAPAYADAAREAASEYTKMLSGQRFDEPVVMFFVDVEFSEALGAWMVLANASIVQRVTLDGQRTESVHLGPLAAQGSGRPDYFAMFDIAVDESGSLLCGADPLSVSAVACYRLRSGPPATPMARIP